MSLVDQVITWYSAHMNYASITALMAVESSFIPFPSEVVIPPAAFVAGQPDSVLCTTGNYPVDVLLIILFGTLGAMIGAIINYGLSVWLGRIVIYKFADSRLGHMCLLSSEKIQRAEEYFREKGNVSTFVGRFIRPFHTGYPSADLHPCGSEPHAFRRIPMVDVPRRVYMELHLSRPRIRGGRADGPH